MRVEVVKGRRRRARNGVMVMDMRMVSTAKSRLRVESFSLELGGGCCNGMSMGFEAMYGALSMTEVFFNCLTDYHIDNSNTLIEYAI